jgi:hypothetical protein
MFEISGDLTKDESGNARRAANDSFFHGLIDGAALDEVPAVLARPDSISASSFCSPCPEAALSASEASADRRPQ